MAEEAEETLAEEVRRIALLLLRTAKGMDPTDVARLLRLSTSQMSNYEQAIAPVPPATLERVAEGTDFPPPLLSFLERGIASFLVAGRGRGRASRVLPEWHCMERMVIAREVADLLLAPLARDRPTEQRPPRPPRAEDREELAPLVAVFRHDCTPALARLLIEEAPEYRAWPLCEQAALMSCDRAQSDPSEARQWAELAVDIAALLSAEDLGGNAWRGHLDRRALRVLADI